MKKVTMPEAERIAKANLVSFGVMKEYTMMRMFGMPPAIEEAFLDRQSEISHGQLCALCLNSLFLYDRCIKAGIVDQSAVDAQMLATMRNTLDDIDPEILGKLETQTPAQAVKEFYSIVDSIMKHIEAGMPVMPTSEAVIRKARGTGT